MEFYEKYAYKENDHPKRCKKPICYKSGGIHSIFLGLTMKIHINKEGTCHIYNMSMILFSNSILFVSLRYDFLEINLILNKVIF